MKCENISCHLSAKIDGELPADLLEIVDRHLAGCNSCQAEWQELLEQEALLHELPWEDPGQPYWDDYLSKFHRRLRRQNYRRILALAAMLLLGATIALYLLLAPAGNTKTVLPPSNIAGDNKNRVEFAKPVPFLRTESSQDLLDKAYRGDLGAGNAVVAFYQKYPRQLPTLQLLDKARDRKSVALALRIFKAVKTPESFAAAYRIYLREQEPTAALQVLWAIDRRRSLAILAQALNRPATQQAALRLYQQAPSLVAWYLHQQIRASRNHPPGVWINALAMSGDNYSYRALVELASKGRHRSAALRALGNTRRSSSVLLLLTTLRNHELRQAALVGLQKMRPLSTEVLLRFTYSGQLDTASLAVEALGLLQDDSAIARLAQLSNEPALQKTALQALAALKSPACSYLFIGLAENSQFRKQAFQALAYLHTPEVLKFLINKLYDPECRQMALAALKQFRAPQAMPHILHILLEGGAESRALAVLDEMPRQQLVPFLIEMLHYPSLQGVARRSLEKITGKDFGPDPRYWGHWYRQIHSS